MRKRPAAGAAKLGKRPAKRTSVGGPRRAHSDETKASGGWDSDGKQYKTIGELWTGELSVAEGRDSWYAKGTEYWKDREVSLEGILGGFPETHEPDVKESRQFLELLRSSPMPPAFEVALDAGAGIGRVARGLLQEFAHTVDLVEPNGRFLEAARLALPAERVGRCAATSLQLFEPERGRYDLVWAQGVLLYLPDDDLVLFLERCRAGLRENGVICIKENVVLDGKWWVDREDNSIARTDAQLKVIFARARLELAHEVRQVIWPKDLLPVMMYALKPAAVPDCPHPASEPR